MSDSQWRVRKMPKEQGVSMPKTGAMFDTQQEAEEYAREQSRKNGHTHMIEYRSSWQYVTKITEEKANPESSGARAARAMRVLVRSGMTPEEAAPHIRRMGMDEALRFELGLHLDTHDWQETLAIHSGDALAAMEELFPEEVKS